MQWLNKEGLQTAVRNDNVPCRRILRRSSSPDGCAREVPLTAGCQRSTAAPTAEEKPRQLDLPEPWDLAGGYTSALLQQELRH